MKSATNFQRSLPELANTWRLRGQIEGIGGLCRPLLMINATNYDLMQNFYRPADEKRMVVILPEASYIT